MGTVSLWNLPFVRGSCRLAQELEKQSVGPLALAAGWRPEGGGGSLLRVLGRLEGTRRFRRGGVPASQVSTLTTGTSGDLCFRCSQRRAFGSPEEAEWEPRPWARASSDEAGFLWEL